MQLRGLCKICEVSKIAYEAHEVGLLSGFADALLRKSVEGEAVRWAPNFPSLSQMIPYVWNSSLQ